jgi:hypothetical protein
MGKRRTTAQLESLSGAFRILNAMNDDHGPDDLVRAMVVSD